MPIQLDSSSEEIIKPAESIQYDSVKMKGFYVDDEGGYAEIVYRKLLNGVVQKESSGNDLFSHRIEGITFGQIALSAPVGATRREDLKNALYEQMIIDLGLSGVIE